MWSRDETCYLLVWEGNSLRRCLCLRGGLGFASCLCSLRCFSLSYSWNANELGGDGHVLGFRVTTSCGVEWQQNSVPTLLVEVLRLSGPCSSYSSGCR